MNELKLIGNVFSRTNDGIETVYIADVAGNILSMTANVASEEFTIDELNTYIKSKNDLASKNDPVASPEKNDIVRVTRHFRRHSYHNDCVASHGGIAAVCHLDYVNNLITVYPAMCSAEDNYDKEMGLALAETREKHDIGFIVKFDKTLSIRENIYEGLHQKYCMVFKDSVIYLNEASKQSIEVSLYNLFMGDDNFSGVFDGI